MQAPLSQQTTFPEQARIAFLQAAGEVLHDIALNHMVDLLLVFGSICSGTMHAIEDGLDHGVRTCFVGGLIAITCSASPVTTSLSTVNLSVRISSAHPASLLLNVTNHMGNACMWVIPTDVSSQIHPFSFAAYGQESFAVASSTCIH